MLHREDSTLDPGLIVFSNARRATHCVAMTTTRPTQVPWKPGTERSTHHLTVTGGKGSKENHSYVDERTLRGISIQVGT